MAGVFSGDLWSSRTARYNSSGQSVFSAINDRTHDCIVISPLEVLGETATIMTCAPSQSANPSAKDGKTVSAISHALGSKISFFFLYKNAYETD